MHFASLDSYCREALWHTVVYTCEDSFWSYELSAAKTWFFGEAKEPETGSRREIFELQCLFCKGAELWTLTKKS